MTLIHFFTHTELAFKTLLNFQLQKVRGPVSTMQILSLISPFSIFFLPLSFFPDFFPTFFRTFFSTFLPTFSWLNFLDFFTADHIRQRPGLILGFVTMLFIAENVIPWSLTSTFLSYNKAMLSQARKSYLGMNFKEILPLVGLAHCFYIKYVAFEEHF